MYCGAFWKALDFYHICFEQKKTVIVLEHIRIFLRKKNAALKSAEFFKAVETHLFL